jgi:hypothetical protein
MEDTAMSATATATTSRIVEIAPSINALHEPESGLLEFRLFNAKGDFILATSNWNALTQMTDEEIREYYSDRRESIEVDFSEALRMRF